MDNHLILHPTAQYARPLEIDPYLQLRQRPSARPEPMQTLAEETEVLFVSSYPPRECGIATYTQDLVQALALQFDNQFHSSICAIETDATHHRYTEPPAYILETNDRNAFAKTAFRINRNPKIALVVVQHEFGLFADNENAFRLFLEQINKPVVLVFHTVLPAPSPSRKVYVQGLTHASNAIVVMTSNAASLLQTDYEVNASKIKVIPHGTHLLPHVDRRALKARYQLTGKNVLATFGLLGPGKSIETTLRALPAVLAQAPNTMFLILGKTHPSIIKNVGEQYRTQLEELIEELGLEQNVRFVNEYLPLPVLLAYLQLTDIYLFTSKDRHQAVSGTFAYAVSSGCPIVSTPIPHAREVLSHNNGIIIDFEDDVQLSAAILQLLGDEKLRRHLAIYGLTQMAATAWSNTALAHGLLFNGLTHGRYTMQFRMPDINLSHIHQLSTAFGMLQFSQLAVPDPASGFTVDDNARALIAVCQDYQLHGTKTDLALAKIYLRFLESCLLPNGEMLNYVDRARQFTLQNFTENLEDSTGRAIWALGYVSSLQGAIPAQMCADADKLLEKLLPLVKKAHSTRAMAFAIKGLCFQNKEENRHVIELLANRLQQMYLHEQSTGWPWYEPYLTYANSVIPEAMLFAFVRLQKTSYRDIAVESFTFLMSKQFVGNTFKAISNKGWIQKERIELLVNGGEQPIEVAYTLLALELFYQTLQNKQYLDQANIVFSWFLGQNHLQQIVYNPATGGCYDGLEATHVNLNQGAESTVSYLLGRLSIERMHRRAKRTLHTQVFEA